MESDASRSAERGFSLIEVAIATSLLAVLALGVAQMFALGALANLRANQRTSESLLAVEKMEQLKALQWGFDTQPESLGLPISDLTTDLSACAWTSSDDHCADLAAPAGGGGMGLNPSPAGSLDNNVPGYVDYLDRSGAWVGAGAEMPPDAHYVRRWSIEPLPTNPNNTLVFQVRVLTRLAVEANRAGGNAGHVIVGVKTRKAS